MNVIETCTECVPRRPRCQVVREFLRGFAGRRVFTPNIADDNGNELVVIAMRRMFEDLGIAKAERPEDADLIVIGSNGGMMEKANWIPRIFHDLWNGHPGTPLCVLPSSYLYPTQSLAPENAQRRSAPVTLFCREVYSHRHLLSDQRLPECCSVMLDDDAAFDLESSSLVAGLRQQPKEHILIVERTDIEHVAVALESRKLGLRRRISRHMPQGLKRLLYPLVNRMRAQRRTPFRALCEQMLLAGHPQHVGAPRFVADIGNINTCRVDGFLAAIARAHAVFTMRMHVGILSAMLGTPTYIFEGPYHKIRGVYEYSMAHFPHARLCRM